MNKYVYIGWLLLLPVLSTGQETRIFRNLDMEHFKGAGVLKVVTDKTGLAWVLTTEGFVSYDGTEIKRFPDTSAGSYTSPTVSFLPDVCLDGSGNLYAWKYDAGLVKFNTRNASYTLLKINNTDSTKFRTAVVQGLYIDRGNTCWLPGRSGLIRFDLPTGAVSFFGFSDENLNYLDAEGHDRQKEPAFYESARKNFFGVAPHYAQGNQLWVVGGSNIWQFDTSTHRFTPAVLQDPKNPRQYGFVITHVLDVNKDSLVFSTMGGGLGFYSKASHSYRFLMPDSSLYQQSGIRTNKNIASEVYKTKHGFFVSFRDGLPAFFDNRTHTYSFITADSTLKGCRIYLDAGNRVWAYNRSWIFHSVSKPLLFNLIDISIQSRPNRAVNNLGSIYWDEYEKKFYAGISFGDGVQIWNPEFERINIIPSVNPPEMAELEPPTWDITNACGASWAIGMGNRLLVLNNNQYISYRAVKDFAQFEINWTAPEREALDLLRTGEDELFILGGKGDLYQVKGKNREGKKVAGFRQYDPQSVWGLGKLLKGNNSTIIVSDFKTIYRYHTLTAEIDSFRPVSKSPAMPVNFVDIETDVQGNIWLLTRANELLCYDGKTFNLIEEVPVKLSLGFFSNMVITPGNILIAGETNSIVVYDISRKRILRFNEGSGMRMDGFSKILYANGQVFFSYADMVQAIPVENLLRESRSPLAYLTSLAIYGKELSMDSLLTWQHDINLSHGQNFLNLRFSALDFDNPHQVAYWYRVPQLDTTWVQADFTSRGVSFANLRPGNYTFEMATSLPNGQKGSVTEYNIRIKPAWWQTWWFRVGAIGVLLWLLIAGIMMRIRTVRKQEAKKARQEKEMLELEARALRAQMNPHFVFNCLNSIKSLIQQHDEEKSVVYLTTFSKLIRGLFNNADKKEISLFDEIETCRHYIQLEAMRFDARFTYEIIVDPNLDLKSIPVPALIVQPFIENAIWHGIVPRKTGGRVTLEVKKQGHDINIIVEDNGIGRKASRLNKSTAGSVHHSRGVNLTQSRLKLDNLLQNRKAQLDIIDLASEKGEAEGTRVIITISAEE